MLVAAHRYTGSALSSDYVLTNVPLAAEWPSVERADRTAQTPAFLNVLLQRDPQIFNFPLAVPLYLSVTTTILWPLPLSAERKTLSTIDSLIQMEKCIREVESCVCCAFLCFIINFMLLGLMCSIGRLFQYPFLSSYRFCFSVGSPYIHTCDKACVFGCRPHCEVVRLYLRYWKGWRGVWLLAGRLKQLFRRD